MVGVEQVPPTAGGWRAGRRRRRSGRRSAAGRAGWPARSFLFLFCVVWLIPTAGVVVTSFRTPDAVNSSGWWHVVVPPVDPGQFSLVGYRQAWYGGMADSYLNSLAVTLPAVVIPLLVAGFAAYAFTFIRGLTAGAGID